MKNKCFFLTGLLLLTGLVFANEPSDDKGDLLQWSYTANKKGSSVPNDPGAFFETKRRATDLHVKSLRHLQPIIEQFIEEKQVAIINSRLYNVGSKGQPAPGDPDSELYDLHIKLFCSPLSGYEGKIFTDCNKKNPLVLQHADLKPIVLSSNKFNSEMIPLVQNWIYNLFASRINADLPDYIKEPSLILNAAGREQFVRRLRDQIPIAAAANSLNIMLANRIPIDPKDPNSPSIASSLENEISSRHLNNNWHEAIKQTNDGLEVQKEQLRTLALISHQLKELDKRVERVEMLNATIVNNLTNQQELIDAFLQYAKAPPKLKK